MRIGRNFTAVPTRGDNHTHLIDIHVTLSTTSSLEYDEREVVYELAGDDLDE